MKLTHTKGKPADIKKLQRAIAGRVQDAATLVGRGLAEKTQQAVVRRIPGGVAWLNLYRNAIEYLESTYGDEWSVAGYAKVEISEVPVDGSLLWFTAEQAGRYMAPYNPWPLTSVPGLAKGHYGSIIVRPAAPSGVKNRSEALERIAPNVMAQLRDAALEPEMGKPVVGNGKTYIDMAYMARALELGGMAGLGRRPHWGPAASDLHAKAGSWGKKMAPMVEKLLQGDKLPAPSRIMSGAKAEELARVRKETWS